MDSDKHFNLQLTIQKLEEELSLYRNGTTGEQLVECIREKDKEIETMKQIIAEKNESLRKIAKSSTSVIETCDQLQSTNKELTLERNELLSTIETMKKDNFTLTQQISDNEIKIIELNSNIKTLEVEKTKLTDELNDILINVTKLQERCAVLVKEKSEKNKLYEKEKEERIREVTEYQVSIVYIA
jgi:chromosome segregation ATPase